MVSIAKNICFHSALQLSEAGVEKLKSDTRGVCTVVLRGWKLKHPPGVSDVLNSPPPNHPHTLSSLRYHRELQSGVFAQELLLYAFVSQLTQTRDFFRVQVNRRRRMQSTPASQLIHLLFLPLNCYILCNLNITLLTLHTRFCFFLLVC